MSRIRQRLKKYVLNDTRPQRCAAALVRNSAPRWPQPGLPRPQAAQKKRPDAAPAACIDAPKHGARAPRAGA